MALALLSDVANHLWQSTLILGVACGLAWLLRRNDSRARFAIWLAASLKFLVPFAPLIAIGRAIGWPSPTTMPPSTLSAALNTVNQPFVMRLAITSAAPATPVATLSAPDWPVALAAIWVTGSIVFLAVWTLRWLSVAALVRRSAFLTDADVIARLRGAEAAMGITRPLRAVASDAAIEPGVFGIVRQVLVWPRDLGAHLTGAQIDGVLIHELAHVRRHDNLTAALHLAVETIFWFFPPVWWLERQLLRERELACDYAAMTAGSDPRAYAEGILRTCRLYAESPLTCVCGVTGSDLKKRVAAIVRGHAAETLGLGRRLIMATAAVGAVAMPLTLGALQAPLLLAHTQVADPVSSFEVASIKRSPPNAITSMRRLPGGQFSMTNRPLVVLLQMAWPDYFEVTGMPPWMNTEMYDVAVKPPAGATAEQLPAMYRNLLATRLKLRLHVEPKEVPSFELALNRSDGRLGPGLRPTTLRCEGTTEPTLALSNTQDRASAAAASCDLRFWMESNIGRMVSGGALLDQLARQLSQSVLLRPVTNETRLRGRYVIDLRFVRPAGIVDDTPSDVPEIRTALQEQLGLKLVASKASVDVLAIDHIERPSEN